MRHRPQHSAPQPSPHGLVLVTAHALDRYRMRIEDTATMPDVVAAFGEAVPLSRLGRRRRLAVLQAARFQPKSFNTAFFHEERRALFVCTGFTHGGDGYCIKTVLFAHLAPRRFFPRLAKRPL